MADPYAELGDLTDRFPRELTSAEADRAPILLSDASFWLGVWVPGLAAATETDDQVREAAKLLVVAMVKRALLAQVPENPGVQSITQGAGPYNQSITYRNPEGKLYLYAAELDSLSGLLVPSVPSAVSMRSPGL